jgi:hypothetical protein
MELETKIRVTTAMIRDLLRHYHRPCVLWSGGKDSMALLHLLRILTQRKIDVVCWREPWMPQKQRFVNKIVAKWNLTVWDWHPEAVALCKGNARIDVLNYYSFGSHPMMLARGTERPEGESWLCGRDTFMSRPRTKFVPPWDLAFHGHKSCDVDPCSGAVPLESDLMDTPGMVACAFPLRHWSDDDVFEYLEHFRVPIDSDRYAKGADGKWATLPYQDRNPDYYPACFKCMDPDEGEFVMCPKLGIAINNISSHVRWEQPTMPYCNLRTAQPSTPQPSIP